MNDTTARDRCRGVLIGLAAGDRIGGPVRMAMRFSESLIDSGGFDSVDVLERYIRWWRKGAFDTGPVSALVFALISEGKPPSEAVTQVHREFAGKTAGCNPAHRSLPLSMLAAISDDDLAGCVVTEARLTHYDRLAGEVAATANRLCRSLIRGIPWSEAAQDTPGSGDEGPGNNGGFAPDVLRAAVFFVGTSASFAEALERSVVFAGPVNYCPVLAGAIGGARWGASTIPSSSLTHVAILRQVREAADALGAGWSDNRR